MFCYSALPRITNHHKHYIVHSLGQIVPIILTLTALTQDVLPMLYTLTIAEPILQKTYQKLYSTSITNYSKQLNGRSVLLFLEWLIVFHCYKYLSIAIHCLGVQWEFKYEWLLLLLLLIIKKAVLHVK